MSQKGNRVDDVRSARPGRRARSARKADRRVARKGVRGLFTASGAVVVGLVASLVLGVLPAGAAGITIAQPAPNGDYAACNVNLLSTPLTFTDAQVNIPAYGTGYGAYWQAYSPNIDCNTAFPIEPSQSQTINVWYGSPTATMSSATDVSCTVTTGTSGGTGCLWAADGHVTAACTMSTVTTYCGGGGSIHVGCIGAAWYASSAYTGLVSWQQTADDPYRCTVAVARCTVQAMSSGWTTTYGYTGSGGVQQCSTSLTMSGGTAVEPSTYWGTQATPLPAPVAPTVTCGVTLSPSTGVAAFTGTVTAASGTSEVTLSEGWVWGDGGTQTGSTPNVNHAYTMTAQPSGGWTAVYTAVAVGNGTTVAASTVTRTCSKAVDFIKPASGGAGGTAPDTTNGGSAPPTSCNWYDVTCMTEQAAAWLFVPAGGFYTAWSGFLTTLKTTVPFCYVTGVVTWIVDFTTAVNLTAPISGTAGTTGCLVPANLGVLGTRAHGDGCGTEVSGLQSLVFVMSTGAVISVFCLGAYRALRKAVGEH